MKLLIRNLARSTTEAELQTMFETFGTVQSCDLVIDKKTGTSKGFAFVEMPKQGAAKAAMKTLNGTLVDGNLIRVKKSEQKQEPAPGTATDPMHGITLEEMLVKLVERYDWDDLGQHIDIKCFTSDPSISSSLKFLRKTPWARKKVEKLYLQPKISPKAKPKAEPEAKPEEKASAKSANTNVWAQAPRSRKK